MAELQAEVEAASIGNQGRPAEAPAAAVGASFSTRRIWTALRHDGPNHLGAAVCDTTALNTSGLWLIRRRRRVVGRRRGSRPGRPRRGGRGGGLAGAW